MGIAVGEQLAHPSATVSSHQHHLNHTARHTGASRDTYQSCWSETVHNSRWNFQNQLKSVFSGHFLAYSPKNTACFCTSQSMTIPLTQMHLFPRRGKRRELEKHVQCSALQPAKPDTVVIVVWDNCLSPQPGLSHHFVCSARLEIHLLSSVSPLVCQLSVCSWFTTLYFVWWNTVLIQADSSGHKSSAAHFTHFPFMLQQRESKLYISVFKNIAAQQGTWNIISSKIFSCRKGGLRSSCHPHCIPIPHR